jgi:hypothetical protein
MFNCLGARACKSFIARHFIRYLSALIKITKSHLQKFKFKCNEDEERKGRNLEYNSGVDSENLNPLNHFSAASYARLYFVSDELKTITI